jgi:hypothetical protein
MFIRSVDIYIQAHATSQPRKPTSVKVVGNFMSVVERMEGREKGRLKKTETRKQRMKK